MREPQEFEIDGLTFEFRQMPLDAACAGAELVIDLVRGGLEGQDLRAKMTSALALAMAKLPKLVKTFTPYVRYDDPASGRRVQFSDAFQKDVFDGHIDRAILFVLNCAAIEFGDFLGEGVERLAAGVEALLSRYPSLNLATRPQPTPERLLRGDPAHDAGRGLDRARLPGPA